MMQGQGQQQDRSEASRDLTKLVDRISALNRDIPQSIAGCKEVEENALFIVLGIQPTRDRDAIKRAYRAAALTFHENQVNKLPEGDRKIAEKIRALINIAGSNNGTLLNTSSNRESRPGHSPASASNRKATASPVGSRAVSVSRTGAALSVEPTVGLRSARLPSVGSVLVLDGLRISFQATTPVISLGMSRGEAVPSVGGVSDLASSEPGVTSPAQERLTRGSRLLRLAMIARACATFVGSLTGARDVARMFEGPNSGHFTQAALRAVTMMICITNPALLVASFPLIGALMLESGSMYPKHDTGDMAALGKKLAQKALEMFDRDKSVADGRRKNLIEKLKLQYTNVNKARQSERGGSISAATYFGHKDIKREIFSLLLDPVVRFFTPEASDEVGEELAERPLQPGLQSGYSALLTGAAGEFYSGVAGSAAARQHRGIFSAHIQEIVCGVAGQAITSEEKALIVDELLHAAPGYVVEAFNNAGSTYEQAQLAARSERERGEGRQEAARAESSAAA